MTCSVAARGPTPPGWNETTIVHAAPCASTASSAHVPPLASAKSDACAPATVNACSATSPGPWLASVSDAELGAAPTLASPNASAAAAGDHASTGRPTTPVPVSVTVCGEPLAFEAMRTLPLAAPAAVGVKTIESVQLAAAGRLEAQLFETANAALAAMLESASGAEPLLVSVTVRAPEATPIDWLPKSSVGGASATAGTATAAPVPDRLSTALPLTAFDAIEAVAVRVPTAPGVKLNSAVQVAPGASTAFAAHVPETPKSAAAVPVSVVPASVSGAAPLLLTSTLWPALVLPTVWVANVSAVALSEIAGCAMVVPVPFNATVDGEPAALWAIVRLAVRAPVAAGVDVTLTTHDAFAATLPPAMHVVPEAIWNSPAWLPVIDNAPSVNAAVPVLLNVIVCAAEVVLTVWLNASVDGETTATGFSATPVPERLATLWPAPALCVTTRLALRAPAAAGANETPTLQLPPAAIDAPAAQVPPAIANSLLAVERVPTISGAVPVFARIAVCAAPVAPRLTLPNASDAVSVATGAAAAAAVPASATVVTPPAALCAIVSVPLRAPSVPERDETRARRCMPRRQRRSSRHCRCRRRRRSRRWCRARPTKEGAARCRCWSG